MSKSLEMGSTIGILGGGQLGRMLAVAASRLGLQTHIFDPSLDCPASHVCAKLTTAEFDDTSALLEFASSVDVVTYEFENIPANSLDHIENTVKIFPPRNALSVSQDRLEEKNFLQNAGLRVAPFANIEKQSDLDEAIATVGVPSILKTRRFGYDGKGQVRVRDHSELENAWNALGNVPCVLEGFVSFTKEVSVIAARGQGGEIAAFDVGENVHIDGILHSTTVPTSMPSTLQDEAKQIAAKVLSELSYVGIIGVELFVTDQGLIVNEFAPRVHNSGHWTQNGCTTDQFEQHIRAICGWSLGDPKRYSDVEMINIVGDEFHNWEKLAGESGTALHLYGKQDVRDGRKMGHINRVR